MGLRTCEGISLRRCSCVSRYRGSVGVAGLNYLVSLLVPSSAKEMVAERISCRGDTIWTLLLAGEKDDEATMTASL